MVLAWFPITSSWNTACYIRGLIHGIGRGVPNAVKRLWPGHEFCQGQMMHKPRKRELSILLTAHRLDKIHIFMKFRHHIPYGSEVWPINNVLPKYRQFNS